MRTFAKTLQLKGLDATTLPLSRLSFSAERLNASKEAKRQEGNIGTQGNPLSSESSTLMGRLQAEAIRYEARSPFAALSGLGDNFASRQELIETARNDIHLDLSAIPIIADIPSIEKVAKGSPGLLNRFALDFYHHGQLDALSLYNNLKAGEAYHAIEGN